MSVTFCYYMCFQKFNGMLGSINPTSVLLYKAYCKSERISSPVNKVALQYDIFEVIFIDYFSFVTLKNVF